MSVPEGVPSLGASSTFLGLISNDPDGQVLMQGMCLGPMAAYGALGAALHAVDADRENLLLVGHHGFTPQIAKFATVPVAWDFPVTRVFHSGEALFVKGTDVDGQYPLLSPGRALIPGADPTAETPLSVSVIALPVFYAGSLTAVCSVVARHDEPWSWADMTHLQGTCSALGLWQRVRHLSEQQITLVDPTRVERIRAGGLTDRQRAIVALIREGKSNASIARTLGFSVGTVKAEIQALLALLSARNRLEIVQKADRAGITGTPA